MLVLSGPGIPLRKALRVAFDHLISMADLHSIKFGKVHVEDNSSDLRSQIVISRYVEDEQR